MAATGGAGSALTEDGHRQPTEPTTPSFKGIPRDPNKTTQELVDEDLARRYPSIRHPAISTKVLQDKWDEMKDNADRNDTDPQHRSPDGTCRGRTCRWPPLHRGRHPEGNPSGRITHTTRTSTTSPAAAPAVRTYGSRTSTAM